MSDQTDVTEDQEVPPTPRPGGRARGTGTTGATDTPPKRPRAKSKPKPEDEAPPRETPGRKAPLQRKLEELLAAPALIYSFTGDEYAAHIVATRTPAVAEAWYELSKENPAVRRVLTRLVEGSAWGGVVMSSAAVAIPLLAHHGLIPDVDPFASLYPPPPEGSTGPIVPPPPMPDAPRPPGAANGAVAGGTPDSGMTPPLSPTEPPGVVTVAGTNNNARG